MLAAPDIVVTGQDSPHVDLAIEAKAAPLSSALATGCEARLRRYMAGMRCPVGMLVGADRIRIYRDEYREVGVDSIALIGEYPTTGLPFVGAANAGGATYEGAVQDWLESLRIESVRARLLPDLRVAIEAHVLPALVAGHVRAGTPRLQHVGS